MEAPVELIRLGVERAADTTTMDNLVEMVGMVDCLSLEFNVLYTSRLLQRPEFANPPLWVLIRLTNPTMMPPKTGVVTDAAQRLGLDIINQRLDDEINSVLGLPTTEEKQT